MNDDPDRVLDGYLVVLAQGGSREAFDRLTRRFREIKRVELQIASLTAALRDGRNGAQASVIDEACPAPPRPCARAAALRGCSRQQETPAISA